MGEHLCMETLLTQRAETSVAREEMPDKNQYPQKSAAKVPKNAKIQKFEIAKCFQKGMEYVQIHTPEEIASHCNLTVCRNRNLRKREF